MKHGWNASLKPNIKAKEFFDILISTNSSSTNSGAIILHRIFYSSMLHTFTVVDYYKLLKLPLNASHQEIRAAYKKFALKYHPDKTTQVKRQLYSEIFKVLCFHILGFGFFENYSVVSGYQ